VVFWNPPASELLEYPGGFPGSVDWGVDKIEDDVVAVVN
jgi:hypothetical protein